MSVGLSSCQVWSCQPLTSCEAPSTRLHSQPVSCQRDLIGEGASGMSSYWWWNSDGRRSPSAPARCPRCRSHLRWLSSGPLHSERGRKYRTIVHGASFWLEYKEWPSDVQNSLEGGREGVLTGVEAVRVLMRRKTGWRRCLRWARQLAASGVFFQ